MCGIFAYVGDKNASQIVFQGLRDLQYRGYDSWGIAALTNEGILLKKDTGALPEKISGLEISSLAFGHTRWATHGGVLVKNSHPHRSCDHRYVVVHNGIIENASELKTSLHNKHIYHSDTDTEVIVHYLEEQVGSKDLLIVLRQLISLIKGHSAFVVLDSHTKTLYAYRSGSPLVLGRGKDELFISSDLPTLSPQVDQIYPLHDGELIDLSQDLNSLKWLTPPRIKVDHNKLVTRYHMESEMYETEAILAKVNRSDQTQYQGIAKRILKSKHLILTGCGSSYHACLYGQYLFAKLGIVAHPVIASEGFTTLPTITSDTIMIVLSQSGETIDSLDYVQAAKARGAYVIAMTNVRHSSLDRLSDVGLNLEVGVEVAVASTKAFVFMQLFFIRLTQSLGGADLNAGFNAYAQALKQIYQDKSKDVAKKLAKQLVPYNHLFVVSRADLLSLGYEAALKFKEIGYLHAENIVSGELKHGPLALITESSLCMVIKRENSHDLDHTIAEVKARQGDVVEVVLPDLGVFTALYGANFLHLVSFYHALELGHNPDRPRNLAKSVTVK